jgi:PAS domain S-box-containing protein
MSEHAPMAEARDAANRTALAGVPLEMFRDLCENAQDLIQSVAPDGRLMYVNPAWRETLGYSADESLGMRVFDVIDPESLDHCMQAFGDVMRGGRLHNVEFAFRAKDGRRIDVFGSAVARFENGVPLATSGVFHEVTEAKRLDLERRRLFDLSLDLLCIAGTDGFFKQINPAFGRVLGYPNEELMSRPFVDFVHPEDLEKTFAEIGRLNAGEPSVDFQNRYLAKDGTWRWISWRAAPLAGLGLIYAIGRDITLDRETQTLLTRRTEALARSNADLEQFAYTASHDLRAPLRGIRNLTGWIAEEAASGHTEKLTEHLAQMRQRVDRMDSLIEDLLRYYRAGYETNDVETVDTGEVVAGIATLLGAAERFAIRVEGTLPVFETARAPLELVLRNLIGNAIKHHDLEKGTVTVSARRVNDRHVFAVGDDGPGIPAAEREKVFGMFHRLAAKDAAGGSGMGLALVRRIVERYGGKVRVEPGPARGTTIVFSWPAVMARAENGDAPAADR